MEKMEDEIAELKKQVGEMQKTINELEEAMNAFTERTLKFANSATETLTTITASHGKISDQLKANMIDVFNLKDQLIRLKVEGKTETNDMMIA